MKMCRLPQASVMILVSDLLRVGVCQLMVDGEKLEGLEASCAAAVLAIPGAYVQSSNSNGGFLDSSGKRQVGVRPKCPRVGASPRR